jgi:hypothetical protein
MARNMKKPTPITREVIAKVKELYEVRPALTKNTIAELANLSAPSVRKIEQTGFDYDEYKAYWSTYLHRYDRKKKKNKNKSSKGRVTPEICAASKLLNEAGMSVVGVAKALNLGRSTVSFIKQADWDYKGYCDKRDGLAAKRKAMEEKVKIRQREKAQDVHDVIEEQNQLARVNQETATLAKEFDRAVNLTTIMVEELKKSNQLHAEIQKHLKEMAFHIQQLYVFEHNKNERWSSRGLFSNRKK